MLVNLLIFNYDNNLTNNLITSLSCCNSNKFDSKKFPRFNFLAAQNAKHNRLKMKKNWTEDSRKDAVTSGDELKLSHGYIKRKHPNQFPAPFFSDVFNVQEILIFWHESRRTSNPTLTLSFFLVFTSAHSVTCRRRLLAQTFSWLNYSVKYLFLIESAAHRKDIYGCVNIWTLLQGSIVWR